MIGERVGCILAAMVHRTLIFVAALLGGLMPGLARGGDTLAELVAQVEARRKAKDYAGAAELAAEGAARADLGDFDRVVLGGLAQQNFKLSYEAGGPVTELCELAKVMRLVARLDSEAGRVSKIKAAQEAEAQLERAAGPTWRAVCMPAEVASVEVAGADRPRPTSGERVPAAVESPTRTTQVPQEGSRPMATSPAERAGRRRVRAGVGTLVPGLVMFAPMAALLAHRGAGERQLWKLNADATGRELTETEAEEAASLQQRYRATSAGAAVLGATGVALIVTGVVLLTTGGHSPRVAVAPWGGRGVGGLVLAGRF